MVEQGRVVSMFFDKSLFSFLLEVLTMKPSLTSMLPQINQTFQRLFPPQAAPGLGGAG